ncbi:hypothetical protein AC579_6607 [Pseudocercospora musae]|uniref:Aminoglycoside phosphotransferase domain-containing protein n=1 Tax=Pseudocercospora musae TaxID=113226 RepID=A0A139I6X3_9PEZI|nr:hypothetical protein AC579_6607 [Pseudocercospora musae]KXT10272.1 hypothetical protein AC579_6607 [Pseudocercospora musae]
MTVAVQEATQPSSIFRFKMTTSSSRSPDRGSVQRVAAQALQTKAVTVERYNGAVFRTFRLQPSSDFFYILRCCPSTSVRLLHHEEGRLQAEALILQALRGRSDLLVPRLIEYSNTASAIGSLYCISGPFRGAVLSDVEPRMSKQALSSTDKSLGQYVRRLTYISGSAFGAVRPNSSSSGISSWSRCFTTMLESVLCDAEDALVSLPYDFVREQIRRHRSSLDMITQPKLFLLEMVNDKNLLVDTKYWTISGVLDFSTATWGDPFMSDCFYTPSVAFVEGFGKLPNSTTDERIRQYLYILYHSLLSIVRQCYRPSEDGDELGARRNLTTALTQLSSIGR